MRKRLDRLKLGYSGTTLSGNQMVQVVLFRFLWVGARYLGFELARKGAKPRRAKIRGYGALGE